MEVSRGGDESHYRIMIRPPKDLRVLDMADDPESTATNYRISKDNTRVVYISIDAGVYDDDDYCFAPALLDQLPPFPPGEWNKGYITRTEDKPEPYFAWTRFTELPGITATWHEKYVEYHELEIGEKLMPNVAEAAHAELGDVIAKFARFEWEIAYYQAETEVYHWLNGHDIGPPFLGHITEGGRVIGFLLQKLDGHHAGIEDLARCEDVVRKLHSLDILHSDLNRHNFLVDKDRIVLIDFETSTRSQDEGRKAEELRGLKKELVDNSGKGGQRN
ncbi:MAG: hypothetical protein Q9166_006376 [cf. Caloplaca sp. 2 TL-2023]